MTVETRAGTEGWHADPFGRHEVRFHDGQRWTPYVRDGERHAMDEPVGSGETAAGGRGGLMGEPVLVVEHLLEGRRRDRTVTSPDGRRLGLVRPASPSPRTTARRMIAAKEQFTNDAYELVDDRDHVVLTLLRPVGAARSTLVVRDAGGRETGRVTQQRVRTGGTTYALVGANGAFLGDARAEDWGVGDVRVLDTRDHEVAGVVRGEDLVLTLAQPVPEPLRSLVVGAALGLELGLRP